MLKSFSKFSVADLAGFAAVLMLLLLPFTVQALTLPRDGTLLKAQGPEVFFLENGFRRWVVNPEAFRAFEFDWQKIQTVSDEELEQFPVGRDLTEKDRYPSGVLLRGARLRGGDGVKIYRVENGRRSWIEAPRDFENLRLSFDWVFDVSQEKLQTLPEAGTLKQIKPLLAPSSVITSQPTALVEVSPVGFRFTGRVAGAEVTTLEFDTFLEGVDQDWVRVGGQGRTINLPQKNGRYTFYLRARTPDGAAEFVPQRASFDFRTSRRTGEFAIVETHVSSDNPQQEAIVLEAIGREPAAIAGWTIGSEKFNTRHPIPASVVNVPSHPGEVAETLYLPPGGRLVIRAGRGALGAGFRINNCVGYIKQFVDPPLPNFCQVVDPAETKDLTSVCKNILNNTPACDVPKGEEFLLGLDRDCREFINKNLNYQACVLARRPFYDFFRNEWWVYLGLSHEGWAREGDAVVLRAPDGFIADRRAY